MKKLVVLVGIPGSGKSWYANNYLANDETEVLSSDALRKELLGDETCQTNNELVFSTLYKRAKEFLLNGKNVVIDATNISMKDRRRTLSHFQGMEIERIAIVFATPVDLCHKRDLERDRTVGKDIINKFLCRFEIPMEYEGFDKVIIEPAAQKYNLVGLRIDMERFNQQNPHHKYTVGLHCYKCFELLKDKDCEMTLIEAGYWHDVGKMFTQTFDDNKIAHYYSHHNVGAYIFMCSNWLETEQPPLRGFMREIVFYINYHMSPFFWKEQKTIDKYKKLFGERLFNNLMLLHECDKASTGVGGKND